MNCDKIKEDLSTHDEDIVEQFANMVEAKFGHLENVRVDFACHDYSLVVGKRFHCAVKYTEKGVEKTAIIHTPEETIRRMLDRCKPKLYRMRSDVTILAYQMTLEAWTRPAMWPLWLYSRFVKNPCKDVVPKTFIFGKTRPCLHSIDGDHVLDFGDYVCQDYKGNLHLCRQSVFESIYEIAE